MNKLMKKQKKNNKGFSLVELIVVIAIMAVLIGVIAPQFLGYTDKAKESTDVQNAQALASEIQVIIADGDSAVEEGSWTAVATDDTNYPVQTVPEVKSNDSYAFYYQVDANGNVKVGVGAAATSAVELYPTVSDSF